MRKQRVILRLSAENEDLAIDDLSSNTGGTTPEDSLLNQIKNAEQQKELDEQQPAPEDNVSDDNSGDSNNSGDTKPAADQTDPAVNIEPNAQEDNEDPTATECNCSESVESSLGMEGLVEISDCMIRLGINRSQELIAMESYSDAINLSYKLSAINSDGGLNSHAAQIVKNQITGLANRVGDPILANCIRNVAAFESYSSREQLTTIALEGIKDFMSRIWLAITKAIKRSIQWLQDFYNKVFDQLTKSKESIKKLRLSLTKVTKDTTDKTYSNVASIRRLISDEHRPDPKENMTVLMQFLVKLATPLNGANEASFKALGTMIDQAKNGEIRIPNHALSWYGVPQLNMFDSAPGVGYMSLSRDRTVTAHAYSHVLPGNIRAILVRPDETVNDLAQINIALKQSKLFLGAAEMNVLSVTEIPLLNKAEVKPYLDQLSNLVDSSMNFRTLMQNMQKQKNQIQSMIDQYVKKHIAAPIVANNRNAAISGYTGSKAKKPATIDPSSHLFADSVMSLIRYIDGVYIDGLSKITQLNITFINHSLQYVTNSLSALV